MRPYAHDVMTLRMFARLALRIAWSTAIVLAIASLIREGPAYWLLSKRAALGAAPVPSVLQECLWTFTFAASACWLIVLDFLLLAWLVPSPQRACPDCGYDLTSLGSDRCPECGLVLPKS
ncbi:MAG: hypothetical protein U0572_00375 [Phycisphaerales bacterium]